MVEELAAERELGPGGARAIDGLAADDAGRLAALRGPAHDVDDVRELDSLVYVVGHHQRRGAAGIDHVEKPLVFANIVFDTSLSRFSTLRSRPR